MGTCKRTRRQDCVVSDNGHVSVSPTKQKQQQTTQLTNQLKPTNQPTNRPTNQPTNRPTTPPSPPPSGLSRVLTMTACGAQQTAGRGRGQGSCAVPQLPALLRPLHMYQDVHQTGHQIDQDWTTAPSPEPERANHNSASAVSSSSRQMDVPL